MAQERLTHIEATGFDWRTKAVMVGVAIAAVGAAFKAWEIAATGVLIFGAVFVWPKKRSV